MTATIPHTLTNESITVIHQGRSFTVQKGAPNFNNLRKALVEKRWDAVPGHLTVTASVKEWARGKFEVDGDVVRYGGKEMPKALHERIMQMASRGEDSKGLLKFWERLQLNPSFRSVQQLWNFLQHKNIPLTDDGYILAYKAVRKNYMDVHSSSIENKPGSLHEMPRNEISDDADQGCHVGFHVGALAYAQDFGPDDRRIIVCKVDPADVVCVPNDSSFQKMRVCRYKVLGHYGAKLPSTSFKEDGGKPAKKKDGAPKSKGRRGFKRFGEMGFAKLMEQSMDDLRQYAYKGLNIVGASKILGGKVELVNVILSVRS